MRSQCVFYPVNQCQQPGESLCSFEPEAFSIQPVCYFLILIFMVAFFPVPSVAFAVILTVLPFPAFFVVTTPFALTFAYFLFEVSQLKVLFAVFPVVETFALTVTLRPAFTDFWLHLSVIFFTACFTILILIFALLLLPSTAFAVIVTVFPAPAFFVVTTPFAFTVAYFLLEELQFRVLLAVFPVALTVAFIVAFSLPQLFSYRSLR